MDITLMRIAATLVSLFTFLAILAWAFAGRNRARFDTDARIPFEQD